MDPNLVLGLDRTIHEKSRLSIMTALTLRGGLCFIELKRLLGMTDGNLCVHIRTLEQKGYLVISKSRENRRAKTSLRISEEGRKALHHYVKNIEELARAIRRRKAPLLKKR